MASDIKISQMPNASTLSGTEIIPIVQGGANKSTTISKIKEGLATVAQLNNKVDKSGNKVLSDLNFTTALKTKLDGIEVNANKYTHPTTAGNKHIPSGGTTGLVLVWQSDGTATWGNMEGGSAAISQATSTSLGGIKIGYSANGSNYDLKLDSNGKAYVSIPSFGNVTTTTAGLMSAQDKVKLDGIAPKANNYIHPSSHPATIITQDAKNRFCTDDEKSYWSNKADRMAVTSLMDGLMSKFDKDKLDTVEENANYYILPEAGIDLGGVRLGIAVNDATAPDDIVITVNNLLQSLRDAGIIAS